MATPIAALWLLQMNTVYCILYYFCLQPKHCFPSLLHQILATPLMPGNHRDCRSTIFRHWMPKQQYQNGEGKRDMTKILQKQSIQL